MIDIFYDLGKVPETQKPFKISKRNFFVLLGRFEIIEYSISSSPGDVGEDNEIARSNSSMVKGTL